MREPHVREIICLEPSALALRLNGQRHLTLLESVMRSEHLGRYSFLACNPTATLKVTPDGTFLDGLKTSEAPLAIVSRLVAQNRQPHLPGLPPFQGGLAGYISYDFGRRLEPDAGIPGFEPICPDLMLHRFDCVAAFDHLQERAWIIAADAAEADRLEQLLAGKPQLPGGHAITGWQSNFSRADYEAAIARTIEHILAGDIFQTNITQMFSAAMPHGFDPLAFYRVLRLKNPATFAAFLDYGEVQIASSSPERLLRLDGASVEARPIKGTRRRDADPHRDAALIAELAASRKDRAENVMIVDLLRNDLSRVSQPGTVKVPVLCGLETYANVHHLVSVITSQLRPGRGIGELLAASFPGGSITGAPKIRAMEIIAAIERAPRGVYCGSIGYIGFNGHSDFNIAIRTAQFSQGMARVQGGGGITARSQPAAEYEESLTKIRRIMEAFQPMILIVDNYDSFVHNIARYFEELGEATRVVRNDRVTAADLDVQAGVKAIVISPGPGTPVEAGRSMAVMRDYSGRLPILGICLGHQVMGAVFGGAVRRARRPMHGDSSEINHDGTGLFEGLPQRFSAGRYHSLIVDLDGCDTPLEVTARSDEGEIMGLRHVSHPTWGVQFHPESILTEGGYDMLRNFLKATA